MAINNSRLKVKKKHRSQRGKYYLHLLRRTVNCICLASLVVGTALGVVRTWEWLRGLEYFEVTRIEIDGAHRLKDAEVQQLAGLTLKQSIFDVDPDSARKRLKKHPYVLDAELERRWPKGIHLTLRERQPAVLVNAGELFLVDKEGMVLEATNQSKSCGLPLIFGLDPEEVEVGRQSSSDRLKLGLDLLLELKAAGLVRKGCQLDVSDPQMPVFYTAPRGTRVRLGCDGIRQGLDRLQRVQQTLNARILEVEYLDLRFKDMVVVKFRSTGA